MTNHFIRITSNGGYIGRWFWTNSGSPAAAVNGHWGGVTCLEDCANLRESIWAGSLWVLRVLTR
jgi:hypothetical protein